MNTKRWITLCIFVLTLIVALAAAYFIARQEFGAEEKLPLAEETATPAPEPTAEPLPALVAYAAPQADAAFRGVIALLPRVDLIDTEAALAADLAGLNAALIYVDTAADAEAVAAVLEKDIPVIAYNPHGLSLPEAANEVRYAASVPETAEAAMTTAIAYPPHDTPVRLLGVFESQSGEAIAAWNGAVETGKVLDKGTYCTADGGTLSAWFSEQLAKYFPGMIDAVYVESPAQAAELVKAMLAAERDDFEIFTIGSDAALRQLIAEQPQLLPTTVQVDEEAAAAACAELLTRVLAGGDAQDIVIGE